VCFLNGIFKVLKWGKMLLAKSYQNFIYTFLLTNNKRLLEEKKCK